MIKNELRYVGVGVKRLSTIQIVSEKKKIVQRFDGNRF